MNFLKNYPIGIMPDLKTLKTFLYPLAILVNTTIGIGIFALPFVVSRAGVLVSLLYFALLGFAVIAIHLMFGQVALETPDYKRLPGFAKIHLGKTAQIYAIISIVIGFLASLAAFIIIGGQFLFQIFSPLWNVSEFACSIVYALAGAILVFFGINIVSRIGFWGLIIFFAIFAIIMVNGLPLMNLGNFPLLWQSPQDIFLPYGAILYALWASSSIPEAEEMLGRKNRKDLLNRIILISGIIAVGVYLLFSLMIVGITGSATAESALIGLKNIFGQEISNLLFFFGFVTSFTSFIIMGLTLKKVLFYDCGFNKNFAWAISSLVPIALVGLGLNDFISIFGLVGGILLGADGIMILLMYQKIRPKEKFLTYPFLFIFAAGIIYEILYVFNKIKI